MMTVFDSMKSFDVSDEFENGTLVDSGMDSGDFVEVSFDEKRELAAGFNPVPSPYDLVEVSPDEKRSMLYPDSFSLSVLNSFPKTAERRLASAAVDGKWLDCIEDSGKQAAITDVLYSDGGDHNYDIRKIWAASFFSARQNADFAFCYDNIDSLITDFCGKEKSVEEFTNEMAALYNGKRDDGVLNSRGFSALAAGTGSAFERVGQVALFAALVADEKINFEKEIWNSVFGDGSYDGHQEALNAWRNRRKVLHDKIDSEFWDNKVAIKENWVTNSDDIGDFVSNAILSCIRYAPELAAQIGIGAVLGPEAVCVMYGVEATGDIDDQFPDMNSGLKLLYGGLVGLINSVTQKYTIDKIVGNLEEKVAKEGIKKGLLSALMYMGKAGVKEGAGEGVEQIATNALDIAYGRRGDFSNWSLDKWFSNLRLDVFEEAFVGAFSGLLGGARSSVKAQEVYKQNLDFRNSLHDCIKKASSILNGDNATELTNETLAAIDLLNVVDDAADPGKAHDTFVMMVANELNYQEKHRQEKLDSERAKLDLDESQKGQNSINDALRKARLAEKIEAFKRANPHNPIDTENSVREKSKQYKDVVFHTVRNSLDYPSAVQEAAVSHGYTSRTLPRAFYYNGEVWIDSSRVRPSEVDEVMLHETVGHKGIEAIFPNTEDFNRAMDDVYSAFRADENFLKVAEKYFPSSIDEDGNPIGDNLDTPEKQRTAAKEFLASEAEKGNLRRPAWKNVLGTISDAFARLTGSDQAMGPARLARMLSRAYGKVTRSALNEFLMNGKSTVVDGSMANENADAKSDFELEGYDPVSLSDEINDAFSFLSKRRAIIHFSKMPDTLLKAGLPEANIESRADIIRKLNDKHSISKKQIIDLPKYYSNPVMVLKEGDDYIVLTEMLSGANDGKLKPVMVSFHPLKKETGEIIFIASVYSRTAQNENKYTALASSPENVLFFDEKKASSINLEERTISTLRNQIGTGFMPFGNDSTLIHNSQKSNQNVDFSLVDDDFSSKDLVAVHNLNQDSILKADDLGGFPMPSIAIVKAENGHSEFGDISLVFDSSSIDPKADKNNKIYSNDAWTPVFPQIENNIDYDKAEKISDGIRKKLVDAGVFGAFEWDFSKISNESNLSQKVMYGDVVSDLKNNLALKAVYLIDSGKTINAYQKEKDYSKRLPMQLSFIGNEGLKAIDEKFGDNLFDSNGRINHDYSKLSKLSDEIVGILRDLRKKKYAEKLNRNPELVDSFVNSYLADGLSGVQILEIARSIDMMKSDSESMGLDSDRIKDEVNSSVSDDDPGYVSWLERLYSGVKISEGIQNGKPSRTESGRKRKWESWHDPVNLENVVNSMKKTQPQKGGVFGNVNFFAAASTNYRNLESVRKDSSRLVSMSQNDEKELKKSLTDRLFDLGSRYYKTQTHSDYSMRSGVDAANDMVDEYVRNKGNRKAIQRELNKYGTASESLMDDFMDLMNEMRNMSVSYFEAKPYRAVGFNEVVAAVVPSDANQKVLDVLKKNGIPVYSYDRDNNQSRIEALKMASESSGVLFSLSDYSEDTVRNYTAILRPFIQTHPSYSAEDCQAYLAGHGIDVEASDARVFGVMAQKENMKEMRSRYNRALSDWLVNMVPMWANVVEQAKGDDFTIVPSERFVGEEFTGTFIAQEFRKYSENTGEKLDGKRRDDFVKRRDKALRNAQGLHSDELAAAIARKTGGDAVQIEQDLIDFYRNLTRKDLQRMYKEWKEENYETDRELERQAMDEYMRREQEQVRNRAVDVISAAKPVVTEEWIKENRQVAREVHKQLFGRELESGTPSQKTIDMMNAALVQHAADPEQMRAANEVFRKAAWEDYRNKLRALRDKVLSDREDVLSLQRAAADYAKANLPDEYQADFTKRIVNLLNYSSKPSGKYPQGRRQAEFRAIIQDMMARNGQARQNTAIASIKEMLDAARLKRNYRGVPVSVLPSEQAKVDRIRFITGLDVAALANLVTANNEELSMLDDMDESMTRREAILEDNALIAMFGNLERQSPNDAERAAETLKAIIEGGKSAFRDKLNQRRNEVETMRQQAIQYYMNGDTEFSNEQNDNGPNRYWVNNMSLPTLMRMGGVRDGWDNTLPGKLYRRIEDATWNEQTDLRNLQNDIDEQLAAIGEGASGRKANFLKDIRNRGRAINELNRVQEHTGVFVTEFSRPVYDQNGNDTGISETGRRKTIRTTIPIEDHEGKNGDMKKGARSLLAEYDRRQSEPVREWNGTGLPRNYLAKDDMEIPVVQLKNVLPKSGISHYDYINRFRDDSVHPLKLHNKLFKNEVLLSGKSSRKIISESYKPGVSPYVFASVLANIDDLFENAKLGVSEFNKKKSTDSLVQLHRLFTGFELDGKKYAVKFTVKEHANPDGTYLYTLASSEIDVEDRAADTKKPASKSMEAGDFNARGTSRESSIAIKFSTLIDKFKLKDEFKLKKIEFNGLLLDDIAVEFLRQQLADYDAGLASAYEIYNDENDDAAFNRMIEEERASGKLVVITPDPKEKSALKELKLSQGAAMQALLTWEQDSFRPGMKWNGWTDESISQLKKFITPENLKLAYWMRDYIARNRQQLDDAVYERFGARMPVNDNYFPGIFLNNGRGRMKEGSLGRGMGTLSVNPGFLVARKFHMLPIDLSANALQTFMDNQMQQIHFLKWDNVLRDIRGVYNNTTVQKIINDKLGGNVSTALLARFSMLANNGATTSNAASQIVSALYKNWIPAKISFNVSSLIKQMFGAAAYANCPDVPVADFLKAFVIDDEYRRFVKLATSSEYYKSRQGGALDKDLIYLLNSRGNQNYNPFTSAIMGMAGWATQKGDAMATLSPFGYAVYRNAFDSALKSGLKESEARQAGLRAWQRATDETQQSGYLKDLNAFQADQGLIRFATMFLSNPIQVMNLEIQAFQEWRRTGSDKARQAFFRRAVVNHLVVPSLMWAVTEMMRHGFRDLDEVEWEDMLTGWLAGPFEGALIAGKFGIQLANYLADMAIGRKGYTSDVVFDALPVASDLMRDARLLRRLIGDDELTSTEILDSMKASGDILIGLGAGSPIAGAIGTTLSAVGSQAKRFIRLFRSPQK